MIDPIKFLRDSSVGRSENQKNQKINNGECFFLCLGIQGTRKIAASLVLGGFSWVLGPPKGYHEKNIK